jgi:hypothetical protein
VGLKLASAYMPDLRESQSKPLDTGGFVLTALGASMLMLGPSLLDTPFVSAAVAGTVTLVGVALLVFYAYYARSQPSPLLDLRLLRIATFRASVLGGSLFRIALGSVPFLLPLFLQEGLGMNPFESGTLTCFTAFGSLTMKWLARHTLRRFGFRRVLIYNAILAAAMIAGYGILSPTTPRPLIAFIILLAGVFPSLQFTSINAIAYADIPTADVARATSLASTVQQISLGMGITVGGLVLQVMRASDGHALLTYRDFPGAFVVMSLFSLGSILFSSQLAADAGAELSGRHRSAEKLA